MSQTLAESVADEWETYVREYAKKRGKPVIGLRLKHLIWWDLERSGTPNARDVAGTACEILKERASKWMNNGLPNGTKRLNLS